MTPTERQELRALPKAELHLHLEGSLSPATLWRLSQRHNFPHGLRNLEACERLYQFTDFTGFIQAIKTASQHLVGPADYAAAVTALAVALRAEGVVYAEVFVSIGILLWREVAIEPYWEAIEAARIEAEATTGVRFAWIFDAVRQFGPEPFDKVLNWAIQLQTSSPVLAIGIGGDEVQGPAAWFADGFDRARAAGLSTTAHAGETAGPEAVWQALEVLRPDRIGHGYHAIEDPKLLDVLVNRQVCLDVCQTSNRRTGVWAGSGAHPAVEFYKRGIKFSVSTDDPGIFGCTLTDEFAELQADGLTFAELSGLAARSFACSFLPSAEREAMARLPRLAPPEAGGDGGVRVE